MKEEKYFDAIIIGGGPAGSTCAIELQKRNYNVCIIDKANFPRQKLCGGLVTQKTVDCLGKVVGDFKEEEYFCNIVDNIVLYQGNNCLNKVEVTVPLRLTERKNFDNRLISYYKKRGGMIFENSNVDRVDFDKKTLILKDGAVYHYKYLIGADGARSKVRQELGYSLDKIGFCLECDVPKEFLKKDNDISIYFDILKNGYGWVFPKKDYLTVGFGNQYSKEFNYRMQFNNFLELLGIEKEKVDNLTIKGAFVPFGGIVENPTKYGNVFLIGDASGLVDPINGEGLYFSLMTGIKVAEAILSEEENKTELFVNSTKFLRECVKEGSKLQAFFYRSKVQKIFFKSARKHKNFIRFYCDNQISYYNYLYKRIILFPFYYYKEKAKNEK